MNKMNLKTLLTFLFVLFLLTELFGQSSLQFNPDTVKAQRFDTGKMWTFDDPPLNYLEEEYGLKFNQDWFDDVRLSALRIPGCTASFVSEDGLMMTNNHCSDRHRRAVEKEGEDLEKNGFYASTLEEERKAPNMYADQLAFILDVTEEVQEAINISGTDEEKISSKNKKIDELQNFYNEETGLNCQMVSLYNGGKYSIYGYRRYNDIRLVFVPEEEIGYFGGDFDNFTFPRYNLDCAFFRAYDENGNPASTPNFYKWSERGAEEDEVIFTVGNPGFYKPSENSFSVGIFQGCGLQEQSIPA